jgi:hypothetical protein
LAVTLRLDSSENLLLDMQATEDAKYFRSLLTPTFALRHPLAMPHRRPPQTALLSVPTSTSGPSPFRSRNLVGEDLADGPSSLRPRSHATSMAMR